MKSETLLLVVALALAVVGCSKEEEIVAPPPPAEAEAGMEATEEVPVEEAAVEQAPVEEEVGGMMNADSGLTEVLTEDLQSVPTALESQDYDSAISKLGAIGQVPMNDQQRQAYLQALARAQQYLLEKAATDASAREAYQKLGRQVTGR